MSVCFLQTNFRANEALEARIQIKEREVLSAIGSVPDSPPQ